MASLVLFGRSVLPLVYTADDEQFQTQSRTYFQSLQRLALVVSRLTATSVEVLKIERHTGTVKSNRIM